VTGQHGTGKVQDGARFPHVRVKGDARERGRQYGTQARERVQRSLEAYERVFAYYTGWTWAEVTERSLAYVAPIEAAYPSYLDEMRGVAAGAGAEFDDVLALNLRTEVMFAAKSRTATGRADSPPSECSSFCILPDTNATGHVLVGENWDWLTHCADTLVVLEVEQIGAPDFVTVVEAGLLAKAGMNSSGIAVATNALVTDRDRGDPGIPYHVCLRAFLDAETLTEALASVQRWKRSSSANYLLTHRDGVGIDVESAPGDFSMLSYLDPRDGLLVHTNHFIAPPKAVVDVSQWAMPDSLARYQRLCRALQTAPLPVTVESVQTALRDHADHPYGVCCHPDPREDAEEQGATIMSIIMDPHECVMWLADGNPCAKPYRRIDYADFLDKPSAAPRAPAHDVSPLATGT